MIQKHLDEPWSFENWSRGLKQVGSMTPYTQMNRGHVRIDLDAPISRLNVEVVACFILFEMDQIRPSASDACSRQIVAAIDTHICEAVHNVGIDKRIRRIRHRILMTMRVGMNCIHAQPLFCTKCRQTNFTSVDSINSVSCRRYQIPLTDIRL